ARPDTAHNQHALGWPYLLPGGKDALVTILHGVVRDPDSLYIGIVSLADREVRDFGIRGTSPHYASGHVLYVRQDGQLFARPFDVRKRAWTGDERAVAKDVNIRSTGNSGIMFQRGVTDLAVSETGMLVF